MRYGNLGRQYNSAYKLFIEAAAFTSCQYLSYIFEEPRRVRRSILHDINLFIINSRKYKSKQEEN